MQDADNLVSVKVDKIDTNTDSVVPKGLEIGDDGVLAVKVRLNSSHPGYGLEITDDGCLAVKLKTSDLTITNGMVGYNDGASGTLQTMINTAVTAQLDAQLQAIQTEISTIKSALGIEGS